MKGIIDAIGSGLAAIFVVLWWFNPFKRKKQEEQEKED